MEDTPRRLLALLSGLPMEASVWRAEASGWSQQDELLATCAELIDAWGRQLITALVAVNGGRMGDQGEPLRIRHPDRQEPEPPKQEMSTDPSQIAAFLRRPRAN